MFFILSFGLVLLAAVLGKIADLLITHRSKIMNGKTDFSNTEENNNCSMKIGEIT